MSAFQSAIHTVCHADGRGNSRPVQARDPHSTKAEAQAAGRERAKQEQTDHIVHDADGTVEQRISYRNRTDSSTGERDQ